MARVPRSPPPMPDEAILREAALTHLARYAATATGLLRVLDRRIARWAVSEAGTPEAARQARETARRVVARLADSGAVNDAAYAAARARSLRRAGKSARAIGAHLAAKGVPASLAGAAMGPDADGEFAAAVLHVRKRRLGPYRVRDGSPELMRKELATLARAGFAQDVARRALRLSREEAEEVILGFRAER